jgi:hypothetical protein
LAVVLAFLLVSGLPGPVQAAAEDLWSDVPETLIPMNGPQLIVPDRYRTVAADFDRLRDLLARAPMEDASGKIAGDYVVLSLPLPGGDFGRFAVVESPVMAPELAAKFPEIKTYAGRGLDDPTATARLDITPAGFHAMVLSPAGTFLIDPHHRGGTTHYMSYERRDSPHNKLGVGCEVFDEVGMRALIAERIAGGFLPASGHELRTYRAAVAATGEYTSYHGGTVALGLAAVTTTMNRVTGVYQIDVAVRMQLVANNNLIIYTNSATDPYSTDIFAMLGQNQANLDATIGAANYDVGHVVSGINAGGVASLGVVCTNGVKARGATGLFPPIGDNFDIDYVAHEIGHQFGANHSFNGNAGACAGGNRNAQTAYEPGSGSTIMAYAGICGSQNLQPHSDDYFHFINIAEIVNYTTFFNGSACPVVTLTGVVNPIVDAGVGGFTIPISTPFTLTATATTVGTPTYCWEESDLGPAGHPNAPSGNAPIFRSFDPVASPSRTFPRLSNILNNTQTIGEILPTYTRNLSFRCIVRDFQAGGVGVMNDNISFAVTQTAGPFLVTSPNTPIQWAIGSNQTVTWNVANTNVAPVNCANVNILLSTDGGQTFPITLVAGTTNDGSETIVVPDNPTSTARVKIAAADNVFFDLSNTNFEILAVEAVEDGREVVSTNRLVLHENRPNPFNPATAIAFDLPATADRVTLRVYDLSGRLVKTLADGVLTAGRHTVDWDGRDLAGGAVASGIYIYELRSGAESVARRMILLK